MRFFFSSFPSLILSHLPTSSRVRIANPSSDDPTSKYLTRASPSISISLVGQPASEKYSGLHTELSLSSSDNLASEDGLTKDIERVCKSVKATRAEDIIIRERLDDKAAMFMDGRLLSFCLCCIVDAYLNNTSQFLLWSPRIFICIVRKVKKVFEQACSR